MTSAQRALNFRWPTADVTYIRAQYVAARRVYRQPAPSALNLTISAFTETAYKVARGRMAAWRGRALTAPPAENTGRGEALSVVWSTATATLLDDDWDDLVELALREPSGTQSAAEPRSRVRIHKAQVARLAILNGLEDWSTWIRSCPNDPRRGGR